MNKSNSNRFLILLIGLLINAPMIDAQVVGVEDLQLHAIDPLTRVYDSIETGEYRYITTNNGLFIQDLAGNPLRHFSRNEGIQNPNFATYAKTDDELLIFSSGSELNCYPNTGNGSSKVDMYRVQGESIEYLTSFSYNGSVDAVVDPYQNVWVFIQADGFGAVFHYDGTEIKSEPVFQIVDIMRIHEPTGQIVVRYFTSFGVGAEIRIVTFDGESFVPFEGNSQDLKRPDPPGNLNIEHLPALQQQYPYMPQVGSVPTLAEAPDGSLWYLDAILGSICFVKESIEFDGSLSSDDDSNPANTEITSFLEHYGLGNTKLKRRISGAVESHATWLDEQYGDLVRINDFVLNGNGDPILALEQVYSDNDFDGSIPQAWIYADQSDQLFNWESPEDYPPPYAIEQIKDDMFIFYSDEQFVILQDGNLFEYNLPSEMGSIRYLPGIQQVGTDRYRVFTSKSLPYSISAIDIVISEDQFEFQEPVTVDNNEVSLFARDEQGVLWSTTTSGIRREHPDYESIEIELVPDISAVDLKIRSNGEVWLSSCGYGVFVISSEGELLKHFYRENGLSANCALFLSEGASGNMYIGTGYGYTIAGDPSLISGDPLPEKTPTSLPENNTDLANRIQLDQNYPNPFNPSTTIHFRLTESNQVKLEVLDVTGRVVSTLINQTLPSGEHHAVFDGSQLASGVYLYKIQTESEVITRKMVLVK